MDENVQIALATVEARYTDGLRVRFDGSTEASKKVFKQLYSGRSLQPNDRVMMIKVSGTWLVAGKIDYPQARYYLDPLASTATLSDVIETVNSIISTLTGLQIFVPRN